MGARPATSLLLTIFMSGQVLVAARFTASLCSDEGGKVPVKGDGVPDFEAKIGWR